MNSNSPDETPLARLLDLWHDRSKDYPGWHGIGEYNSTNFLCVATPEADTDRLRKAAFSRGVSVQFLLVPIFSATDSPCWHSFPTLQPGSRVSAYNSLLGEGCHGTLGAFLSFASPTPSDPVWLLSCQHVLDKAAKESPVTEIHDQDAQPIGKRVTSVSLGRNVDAAVVELSDPSIANPVYTGITLSSPSPTVPAPNTDVQKLGNCTLLTTGTFLCFCPVVDVRLCSPSLTELTNQMLFASKNGQRFLNGGDSGALVVSNGQPAGVLFAETESNDPRSPFGLASPFQAVLAELSKKLVDPAGRPLELLFTKQTGAVASQQD